MKKHGAIRKQPEPLPNRQGILRLLKKQGPSDSESMAAQLGISAMAVRQHLYSLRAKGFVTFQEEQRPIGRPAKMWCLTPTAEPNFPDAHAGLSLHLLASAKEAFGEEGLHRVVTGCAQRQIASYRSRMPVFSSLLKHMEALVSIRNEEGFMAEVQPQPDGSFLLIENHCPIHAGAQACPMLCEAETEIFQSLLGKNFEIKREEHIMDNARRCVYRISPTSTL